MFDYAADDRDEGGVTGRSNKVLVTYDRKVKKDTFYLCKAYWTDEPMVHVCGKRFANRALNERNVTVYTSCPAVTLVVNGVDVHSFAYDLPEEEDAGNWFDDPAEVVARKHLEYPSGFYSAKDSIGRFMSYPVTAEIVRAAMIRLDNPRALHVVNNSVGQSDDPMQSFLQYDASD